MPLQNTPYHMYRFPFAISLQQKYTRAFRKHGIILDEYSALHPFNDFSGGQLVAGKLVIAMFRDPKLSRAYKVLDLIECAAQ